MLIDHWAIFLLKCEWKSSNDIRDFDRFNWRVYDNMCTCTIYSSTVPSDAVFDRRMAACYWRCDIAIFELKNKNLFHNENSTEDEKPHLPDRFLPIRRACFLEVGYLRSSFLCRILGICFVRWSEKAGAPPFLPLSFFRWVSPRRL